jgi:hypothetical protein
MLACCILVLKAEEPLVHMAQRCVRPDDLGGILTGRGEDGHPPSGREAGQDLIEF